MEQLSVVEPSATSSAVTLGEFQDVSNILHEPEHDDSLHGAKLISIVVAVCLAVFCIALDNTVCGRPRLCAQINERRSSSPPFRVSPTTSNVFKMQVRTYVLAFVESYLMRLFDPGYVLRDKRKLDC
jgi:hypothetical protein